MQSTNRRSFIGKLSLAVMSWLSLPIKNNANMSQNIIPQSSIKEKKPMGFMWDTLDPFIFCVHHEDKFPIGNEFMGPATSLEGRQLGDDFIIKDGFRMYHGKTVPGFPGHPHRGFETITIVRDGLVDHADSLGASGRYGEGDVQWMTAGKGVQHSEMFPLLHNDKENPMELFQIWLNLPQKNKMVDPHFKMLWGSTIPKYITTDSNTKKTTVEIMAGSLYGLTAPSPPPNSWAADIQNEVAIYNIHIEEGGHFILPKATKGINRVLYFYTGTRITINNETVESYHSIIVDESVDLTITTAATAAKILVLQGKPIRELVIQYGPFVMNSKEEIQQAFEDFHATQFGGWPWEKYDMVHDKQLGRFAKHADGTYEQGV